MNIIIVKCRYSQSDRDGKLGTSDKARLMAGYNKSISSVRHVLKQRIINRPTNIQQFPIQIR